ncbi:MAG TPA: thioredoxin family protein [Polyangiaceae bacterium]
MRTLVLACFAFASLSAGSIGCSGATAVPPPSSAAPLPVPPLPSDGVADVAPASAASQQPGTIVFVEDDFPRALAEARSRGVPLFVDTWATWCHTCLSMRSYVFPDPSLRRFANRFVWLSLDTERDGNAQVVSKLGPRVLPTLYVIDSATEHALVAWPGSLTANELAGMLDQALGTAPDGTLKHALEVDAAVTHLQETKDAAKCITMAADEAPRLPPGTALADVLRAGISCADDLPAKAPERAKLAGIVALGDKVAGDLTQPILADDRSDLWDYVIAGYKALGEKEHAGDQKRVASAWASFLEDQASRAATPAARAVFDAHRLLAYKALGSPERAVPMLQQSEHDFPDDYNPPARLASAYLAMKKYDDALGAMQRALGHAYGPRKLLLYSTEADVYEAKGDHAGSKQALSDALAYAKTLPLTGGRYSKLLEAFQKRLDGLSAQPRSAAASPKDPQGSRRSTSRGSGTP